MSQKKYPFQKSWRWFFVRGLDFVLDGFKPLFSRKPFPAEVKNILVVRLDHIGDVICTLPAIGALKERFPQAAMTVLTGVEGRELLKENPLVGRVIVFRNHWFSRGKRFDPLEYFRVVFQLRASKFDLGYDFRGDIRNILLMFLGGVKFRVGYGIAGGSGLLHQTGDYDERRHQIDLNLKLLTGDIPEKKYKPKLYLNPNEMNEAKQVLARAGICPGDTVVAIHPEAGYPSKEWDEKNVRRLIELFIAGKDKVAVLGLSKRAKKMTESFDSGQVINWVGQLNLRQTIGVLLSCRVFIGNDSGLSHLAQAVGIPTVVVASGTNEYERWAVRDEPSRVLAHRVSCAPCHLQRCNVAGHPCMSEISSEAVFQAVQELTVAEAGKHFSK